MSILLQLNLLDAAQVALRHILCVHLLSIMIFSFSANPLSTRCRLAFLLVQTATSIVCKSALIAQVVLVNLSDPLKHCVRDIGSDLQLHARLHENVSDQSAILLIHYDDYLLGHPANV